MRRREFIAGAAAAAAGVALGHRPVRANARSPQNRPNVLFIMTDQQHWGMMSCTRNPYLKTPALDGLATSGVRFDQAFVTNPVCVPSRFSLQTGCMPSTVEIGQNEDGDHVNIPKNLLQQSLGNIFRDSGYDTVYGGKLHFPGKGIDQNKLGYRNLTDDARDGLADACVDYLKGPHDKPFFMFASFINPHDICYMAINDFQLAFGGKKTDNLDSRTCEAVLAQARESGNLDAFVEAHCPPARENHDTPKLEPTCITEKYTKAQPFREYVRDTWQVLQWRLHRWAYCRLTEMADKQIGRVLTALRESGLEDNTFIVFTSDHGDMDGAHGLEHKSVLYEESIRVPFLLSHKGKIPAGRVDNSHFISTGLDLLPTLCDYAGLRTPQGHYGRSLRSLAAGHSAPWRRSVVTESQAGRMIRTKDYKYCIYDSGEHREQLINLQNDPGEMQNLAESKLYAKEIHRHRALLRKWVDATGDNIAAKYLAS